MKHATKRWAIIGAIAVIALVLIFGGIYRVQEGEQGLLMTFGKVTAFREPGLYWHIPFAQSAVTLSTSEIHSMEYGFRTTRNPTPNEAGRYQDVDDEAVMLTADSNIIHVEAVYQYTVSDAMAYMFNVQDPLGSMRMAFETIMRRNIQNKLLDDALLNKQDIEREVLPDFQRLLDSYHIGVSVREVRIQNISVPDAVTAAYEDVNNAKNENTRQLDEAERYKNEVLPKARSDAYALVEQAQGYRAEKVAQADGETLGFLSVYEKYDVAKDITRKRLLIETMESILSRAKVKIVMDGSGALKLLPIDTLIEKGAADNGR